MSDQNQLELFKATVSHEKHDGFLYYAKFTEDIEQRVRRKVKLDKKRDLKEYFGMFSWVSVCSGTGKQHPSERPDLVDKYYKDIEITEGSFITPDGVLRVRGSMYHFTHMISPLRNASSLKDLEKYPFPEIPNYNIEDMKEKVKKVHSENKVACCRIGSLYESARGIRGDEQFLMDMITDPDMCDYILDQLQQRSMKRAISAAKAGVDFLWSGDDVANQNTLMFSPKIWRKFIKSRWAEVYEAAKKIKPDIKIKYHSDGNITSIIPELIEIGVDILNPLQPECIDVLEVKNKYGKNIVIDGSIGTQGTMPFGTPEEVKRLVRERKQKLGYDGALILAPTHTLEPEVPMDNIFAFIEACKEHSCN